jgi:tRNA-guanine family transglycosylase
MKPQSSKARASNIRVPNTKSPTTRALITRAGTIPFPTYIPVTTFGETYPLDDLIRPYLPRLARAVMVSHHYAQHLTPEKRPRVPLLIDSGGFAALFKGSSIKQVQGLGVLHVQEPGGTRVLHPRDVLAFQETHADVAFTLDFPIPPGTPVKEAKRRQKLTIANALWALENRRRRDLPLYAVVQAWDAASAQICARAYANAGFEGIAIGGLVPRARDWESVTGILEAVRSEIGALPLHVLGLGHPDLVRKLFEAGVDSVDSSSYVQLAADGKLWGEPNFQMLEPAPMDRLNLALCNLATATGRRFPLSASDLVFSTLAKGTTGFRR